MNYESISKDFVKAFLKSAGQRGVQVKLFTEKASADLASTFRLIDSLKGQPDFTVDEAKLWFEAQSSHLKAFITLNTELKEAVVKEAFNAGLAAIKGAVNTALGISLIA